MKSPGTVGSLIPWWALFVAGLVILLVVVSVSGCATTGSYWVKVRDPVPVLGVIEADQPCGRSDIYGCAPLATSLIIIKRGLRPTLRACVESHERKHFSGYVHADIRGFATDCGDGTLVQ